MRRLALAALALLATSPASAKKAPILPASSAPAWVREAAANQVAGDLAGAASVSLLEDILIEPRVEGGVRVTRRTVSKILRAESLPQLGAFGVGYREDDVVEAVDGWNLLPDGSLRRPDPKDDVIDLPWGSGANLVDDVRLRRVTLPGCIVGSVVAWESRVIHAIDTGAHREVFGHAERPVGRCRLTLRVPPGWTFEDLAERTDAFTRTPSADGVTWDATTIAPPEREEWPPPEEDRLPLIAVRWFSHDGSRGYRDWDAVAAWYRKLADPTLEDAGESTALAARLKPPTPEAMGDALRAAFAFASRDVRYVSIQLGIGGFKPATPASTCANRFGDCKAKSFLMRSVVQQWGLVAHPVLVRTRHAGRVLEGMPSPGQFNHCIAAVKLPAGVGEGAWNVKEVEGLGRIAFMDPTTTSLGPWQLRQDDQGTLGLLVTPGGGRLLELPMQPPGESSTTWKLTAAIDADGNLAGADLIETATGSAAGSARDAHSGESEPELRQAQERYVQGIIPGTQLEEHRIEGLDSLDAPVIETTRLAGGRAAQKAGPLLVVKPLLVTAPMHAGMLPPGGRTSRLWLGLPRERRVDVEVRAPAGWAAEALPRPFKLANQWFDLEGSWEALDAGFRYQGVGRLLASEVPASDYAAFRDALLAAASAEAEGVVLVEAAK